MEAYRSDKQASTSGQSSALRITRVPSLMEVSQVLSTSTIASATGKSVDEVCAAKHGIAMASAAKG